MREKIVDENACALILSIVKGYEPEVSLKKCGIEAPRVTEVAIKHTQEEAIKIYYYDFNMSLTDIAKLYNCTRYSVKSFLDRMGLPVKPRGRYFK